MTTHAALPPYVGTILVFVAGLFYGVLLGVYIWGGSALRDISDSRDMKYLIIVAIVLGIVLPVPGIVLPKYLLPTQHPEFDPLYRAWWGRKTFPDYHEGDFTFLDARDVNRLFSNRVPGQVLIRKSSIDSYELLQQNVGRKTAIVVTGHPGTGKTLDQWVILLHRLQRRLPTAIQFLGSRDFYLFDSNGVHKYTEFDEPRFAPNTWALIDSHGDIRQPMARFLGNPNVFCIYSTSPREDRWRDWSKQLANKCGFLVNKLWSVQEFEALSTKLESEYDPARFIEAAKRWGPSLRTCRTLSDNSLSAELAEQGHSSDVQQSLDWKQQSPVVAPPYISLPPDVPHLIFFVDVDPKRPGIQANHPGLITVLPTPHLRHVLARHLARRQLSSQAITYETMLGHSGLRSVSGQILEVMMHTRFTTRALTNIKIHSLNSAPPLPPIPSAAKTLMLEVVTEEAITKSTKPLYLRPRNLNSASIDGVLVLEDGSIFLLQATVAVSHDIKKKGLDSLDTRLPKPLKFRRGNWKLVIVTHDDVTGKGYSTLKVPQPYHTMPLYYCTWADIDFNDLFGHQVVEADWETEAATEEVGESIPS